MPSAYRTQLLLLTIFFFKLEKQTEPNIYFKCSLCYFVLKFKTKNFLEAFHTFFFVA